MLLSDLLKFEIRNPEGETLGNIRHVMLDAEHGTVDYVAASFDKVVGKNDRLYPIPMESLTLDIAFKGAVLDANKPMLEDAPYFSEDDWPLVDPPWSDKARLFWNNK